MYPWAIIPAPGTMCCEKTSDPVRNSIVRIAVHFAHAVAIVIPGPLALAGGMTDTGVDPPRLR